jgi:polar amino acid transport system substrate-binding protein
LRELTPTGRLRFGLVSGPEQSAFFVTKDARGAPKGVAVELAENLATRLGRPIDFFVAPNSGDLVDGLAEGKIDAAFMPVDDERRRRLDVGPIYASGESTYLVRAGSDIKTPVDVDRPNVRVISVKNTTTLRSAASSLKNTKVIPVDSVEEAVDALRSDKADAFAFGRGNLIVLARQLPGSRVLEGSFQRTNTAIMVPKNHPHALAYVTKWLEEAKASGVVRQAFDNAGMRTQAVAP